MVRTRPRGTAPADLISNQKKWTDRWKRIQAEGGNADWAPRAAKRLLREVILPLAHDKCVFCEGLLDVTSSPEIEHYNPRSIYPDQAFEWTNLLPACSKCNGKKRGQDHRGALLKPDEEDPEPFFWLHVGTGRLVPHPMLTAGQAARAKATIDLCVLQRPKLCQERVRLLGRVGRWVDGVSKRKRLNRILREEWQDLSDPRTEYKLVLRFLLELRKLDDWARSDRKRFRLE